MSEHPSTPPRSDDSLHINLDKLSHATAETYQRAWTQFADWCAENGRTASPASAETCLAYLRATIASKTAWSAARTAVTVIRRFHVQHGRPDPTLAHSFKVGFRQLQARMQSVGIASRKAGNGGTSGGPRRTARDLAPAEVRAAADRDACSLMEAACRVALAEAGPHTARTYTAACRRFEVWCKERNRRPYPARAETIAAYLLHCANGLSEATIRTDHSAIRRVHTDTGFRDVAVAAEVEAAMKAALPLARAARDDANDAQAVLPLQWPQVDTLVETCSDTVKGLRNRALILVGYVAAAGRETLANMTVGDAVEFTTLQVDGVKHVLDLARDSDAAAAEALLDWLTCVGGPDSADPSAPLFRPMAGRGSCADRALRPADVSPIIAKLAAAAGIEGRITGRSLRDGRLIDAVRDGATLAEVKRLGRLTDDQSALRIFGLERELRQGDDMTPVPDVRPATGPSGQSPVRILWAADASGIDTAA